MIRLEWLVATNDVEKVTPLVAAFVGACQEAGIGIPGSSIRTDVSLVEFSFGHDPYAVDPDRIDDLDPLFGP